MPDPQTPPWVQAILADADAVKPRPPQPTLAPPRQPAQPVLSRGAAYLAAQPIEPPLAVSHAQVPVSHIGAPVVGERYVPPSLSFSSLMTSASPAQDVAENFLGPARPAAVARADPYGDQAWLKGAGPPPGFVVGATEPIENLLLPQARPLVQAAAPEALGRLAEQFPAFATDLAKYRSGEALPPALGHLSDVLVQTEKPGVYALKPEVQARIAHFLEVGKSVPRQANWQGSTSDEILKSFANDPELADIWARMIGATSAGTGVPRNTQEAVQGMRHYLMTEGSPFTQRKLETMPGGAFGLPKSKYGNMNLAQLQDALSGDKVEAFAQLMRDHDRIPLDRHAIYALGGVTPNEGEAQLARHLTPLRQYFGVLEGRPPKIKSNGAIYDTLNNSEAYTRVEQALADTLRTLDPDKPLKDVFAQMWEGVREQRGGKFQGGPIDLMGPRGLLQHGAMTDPKQMLKALKMTPGKEWTPAMIAALVAGGVVKPDAPPDAAAPPSPDYSGRGGPTGPLVPPRMSPR